MAESPDIEWCKGCGALASMVGKATHERNCRAGPVTWTRVNPHRPVLRPVPAAKPADDRPPGARRRTTYRYRDPDKWRAYMRDYMRRRRQKKDTPNGNH
jgi:hypothetical protein